MTPNGFPARDSLARVFSALDQKHGILNADDVTRESLADTAADLWRIMLKDCVGLKKAHEIVGPALQLVLDALHVPEVEALHVAEVEAVADGDSDNRVAAVADGDKLQSSRSGRRW